MRPPICEVCDADVDPDTGGLVTFQPDERSVEWRRRSAEAGTVGHPPDTGWFCEQHVDLARETAAEWAFGPGVRLVEALSRAIDLTTLSFTDPPGLGDPIPIPGRSAARAREELRRSRPAIESVLGRGVGRSSLGFAVGHSIRRSVGHVTFGAVDLFDRIDRRAMPDGTASNIVEVVEYRLEHRGEPVAFVRVTPSGDPSLRDAFDEVRVWVGDDRLRSWVDGVLAQLGSAPPDLLDPGPDLTGVDLGHGRLCADDAFEQQWVAWDLPDVDGGRLTSTLLETLGVLCAAAGVDEPIELTTQTTRDWDPMDGAQPPHCPFADRHITEGTATDGSTVRIVHELTHWNDDDVSSATVHCTIGSGGEHDEHLVSIAAHGANAGGRAVRQLWLWRPTAAAIVAAVDDLVASLVDDDPR